MIRNFLCVAAGVMTLACSTIAMAAEPVPANIQSAIADAGRPASDKARDAARKPAEILALAEVGTGDKVGDFIMGGGYFTRLFSVAVGPAGRVYGYQPAEFISFLPKYGTDQDAVAAAYANVTPLRASLGAFGYPEPLDVIFTAQNYHDFHLGYMPPPAVAAVNKALFNSLKPGGVLLLIDHSAIDGSGTRDTAKLHRIDIATVKAELTAAGFVLEAESDLLRSPSDPRTASVFDDAIKGRTDQFILKFRKPR